MSAANPNTGTSKTAAAGKKTTRLLVLISGGGSNMQAVLDAIDSGRLCASVVAVVSSNHTAGGLQRAEARGIPTYVCPLSEYGSKEQRDKAIISIAQKHDADYILLLGYLGICTGELVKAYQNRIINIHPALLPKHGGAGYFGLNVHKAVLASGDEVSGATVHFVDEGTDTGRIIMSRSVPVLQGDTPESLAARVLQTEHILIVGALESVFDKE